MFEIENNAIQMTKGDTGYLDLVLYRTDGSRYELDANDHVCLRVKNAAGTDVIVKENTTQMRLVPADTSSLPLGSYEYSVVVTMANGDVQTVIQNQPFVLC